MDRYDAVAASASDVARSKSASQQHPNAAPADAHAEHTHTANEGGQLSPVPSVSTRSGSISDTPGSQTSLSSAGSSLSSASSLSAMAGGSTGSTGGASGNSLSPAQTSTGGSSIGVLTPSGTAVSAGSDDGTILFVGDLSRGVKEEELEALFSRYGTLQAVDIKRDKLTGNNLGYGFVQLSSRAEATRAKTALQGREVFGRKIRIGWAQKNTTLFVGDLDGSINTTQLVRAFEPFGHIIVEETFVKQPSGKYGFVRFGSREDAERAKSEMNHKMLGSRPIRIGWGDSNFEKHCVHIQFESSALSLTTGASVNAVFHESFFQETFTPFAVAAHTSIQNISLPKHSHTKKLKGFAFIHFEESEAGEAAAMMALQTLTNQFNQTPLPQHLQQAQQIQQNNAHGLAIGHLQSYGGQQAEGHSANSVQTHLLGGIPVKYSFGKRQIFSRHRRANENAAALAAAGGMPGGLNGLGSPALGMHGGVGPVVVGVGGGQVGSTAHLTPMQLQSMAAMMQGMIHGGAAAQTNSNSNLNGSNMGGQRGGGGGGGGRNNGSSYGGGGGGRGNNNPSAVLNPYQQTAALAAVAAQSQPGLYNAAAYLPYLPASPVQQQQTMSRYHTNPQQQSYLANHSVMHSSQQSQQQPQQQHQQQQSSHSHVHSPSQSISAADSAATTWMLQNLAATQGYSQGMAAPLSVQQVQQAYQVMQQQQQQQQQQHPVSGLGSNAYYSSDIAAAAAAAAAVSPPAPALESTTEANLASAASAFFNAQSQYYAAAQQHQHQPQSHSQSNAASAPLNMHQLISDINGMALNQQQQQQQHQQHHPLISSGHSSAATSPSHAANTHALQNYYSQSQIKPLLH